MIWHTYSGTAVDSSPSHVEVDGGRAVDHQIGENLWVAIHHGSRAIIAEVVMTKQGKMFRAGNSFYRDVFRCEKIERPEW